MKRMLALSLVLVLFLFILPVFSVQSAWAQATLENPQPEPGRFGKTRRVGY